MKKKELCELGRKLNHSLVDINQTKEWLIEQVSKDTGLYFDRSYLHKIMTGNLKTPKIVESICRVLDLDDPGDQKGESDADTERDSRI